MKNESEAFEAGYDAGLNGTNTTNTNFKWFGTKESMKDWERGKKMGEIDKHNRKPSTEMTDRDKPRK